MPGTTQPIPEASLRRLPVYLRYLQTIDSNVVKYVSCPDIAAHVHAEVIQVRKDLEAAGIAGRPKVGYELLKLISQLESFLGWDNTKDAFMAGAGSLGAALLGYTEFVRCGLSIVAAFDNDPAKIGTRLRGKEVLHIDQLAPLAQRMHVHMGIITVPGGAAQQVADLMVSGGILAIWNFAPIRLSLPPEIVVHNENLYCSLASLSQKVETLLRQRRAASDSAQSSTPNAEEVCTNEPA